MSKYFKNYKSEGDGEYRSIEKSRVHPRSYSCKPDIGPSGDHKSSARLGIGQIPNFRVNMWLNNLGSSSSENSNSNGELYRLNEDHLEKINFIRRKLHMIELNDFPVDTEESGSGEGDKFDKIVQKKLGTNVSDVPGCCECSSYKSNESRISPQNRSSLLSISELTKNSNLSNDSAVKYKPPLKKFCIHAEASTASMTSRISTNKIDYPEIDINEIPSLHLDDEPMSEPNENKSIQCTSKDTELTESWSHSTDRSKANCHHEDDMRVNTHLMEVDLYVEPEIELKRTTQTVKTPNKRCIKFLPIEDDELTTSDKSKKNEFFEEIVSNCSFNFGRLPTPLAPSHDSFFKSRKKQRKKRFRKKGRGTVEGVKLDKSSIEVQRTFLNTSETNEEIENNEMLVTDVRNSASSLDNTVMTSLAIPPKIVQPLKLPQVTKLWELIHRARCKNNKGTNMDKFVFEDDICSERSNKRQSRAYVRIGTEYGNYREAAEDLLSKSQRATDDMKENEVARLHNNPRKQMNSNNYNTKKKQSIDYDFYSMDILPGRTCDVVRLRQEVQEDSDSECLKAIENCCCIRRIFKRRRSTFFSN